MYTNGKGTTKKSSLASALGDINAPPWQTENWQK